MRVPQASQDGAKCPHSGPPSRPVQQGGSVAPNADRWVIRTSRPSRGDKLGLESRRSSQPRTEGRGRSQRRRGCTVKGENILTLAAPAHFQTERPGPRLRLGGGGSPSCREALPAVPAAVEHQGAEAREPAIEPTGEGLRGATARARRAVGPLSWGSPTLPQTGEPPAAWPHCEKSRRPVERSTVEGGLGFLLSTLRALRRPPRHS